MWIENNRQHRLESLIHQTPQPQLDIVDYIIIYSNTSTFLDRPVGWLIGHIFHIVPL